MAGYPDDQGNAAGATPAYLVFGDPLAPVTTLNPLPTSGGGGGGGAVTVADGADVAEGATSAAVYAGSGNATIVGILKGLYAALAGTPKVGVIQSVYKQDLVVTTGASAAGKCIGGLITITGVGPSGALISIALTDLNQNAIEYDFAVFDDNPSGSVFTNNVLATFVQSDRGKVLDAQSIAQFYQLGATAGTNPNVGRWNGNIPYVAAVSGTIYLALITRGAPSYGTTGDLHFTANFVHN